jgi:hypothetical protein
MGETAPQGEPIVTLWVQLALAAIGRKGSWARALERVARLTAAPKYRTIG